MPIATPFNNWPLVSRLTSQSCRECSVVNASISRTTPEVPITNFLDFQVSSKPHSNHAHSIGRSSHAFWPIPPSQHRRTHVLRCPDWILGVTVFSSFFATFPIFCLTPAFSQQLFDTSTLSPKSRSFADHKTNLFAPHMPFATNTHIY